MSKSLNTNISVVIPAHNEEIYLADCLKAILAQTVKPNEIIVVDNNSTDNTAAIAKGFAGVKVVTQKTPGIAAARDAGFNVATGDIIARTDADTHPDPNWLERILESMPPNIDAVTGPIYYYDLPAQKPFKHLGIFIQTRLAGSDNRPKFLAGSNMAIRRNVWQKIAPGLCHKDSIHEDLDLAIHLIENDFVIGYDRQMRVATSARRLGGDSQDFHKYMKAYAATYDRHHISNLSIKVPMLCYMPLHFVARLSRANSKEQTTFKPFHKS